MNKVIYYLLFKQLFQIHNYNIRKLYISWSFQILFAGNFEGKGYIRRKELWGACQELGIPDQNICLITDTRLPDNPKTQWPVPVVAKLIHQQLEALEIDTLVTFDRGGVSSHANHSAVFYAVAYIFVEKIMPKSKFFCCSSSNSFCIRFIYLQLVSTFNMMCWFSCNLTLSKLIKL